MKFLFSILGILLFLGVEQRADAQCMAPFAKFTYTIASNGFTVSFKAESCDADLLYSWTFGDGAVSTYTQNEEQPTHIYGSDGTYVVRMTVKNACGDTYTQEAIIVIISGIPGAMWLNLTGPTLAIECQQVTYTANVVGGVPPYTYSWSIGNYCSDCLLGGSCFGSGTTTPLIGGPSQTVQFAETGGGYAYCTVTVTDAQGNTASENWKVKVKDALAKIEIRTTAESASCGYDYSVGTNILFWPDIDPLFTFDYPTDYYWDFGDGVTKVDNYDGGGLFLHTYASTGHAVDKYTVRLDICDPNGCMQTSRDIYICDPNGSGGGGPGNTDCELINASNPSTETVTLDYFNASGYPSGTNFQVVNTPGNCFSPITKWTMRMPDCGLPIVPGWDNRTAGGTIISLDLTESWWQANKPWGCISLTGNVNSNNNGCEHCTGAYTTKNCIAYIVPEKLEIGDFVVEGTCTNYSISATIKNGGWYKSGNVYSYKEILWQAFDLNEPATEITDLLIDVSGQPGKKTINLNSPYFQHFGSTESFEFIVKLRVQDFANKTAESEQLVSINPLRLNLEDHYQRCPGVQSQFSQEPLAMGGIGGPFGIGNNNPYTFAWSPSTLVGDNPTFTAPAAGVTTTYSVTVTDAAGCSLTKLTTVTASALDVSSIPTQGLSCSSGLGGASIIPLGPTDLSIIGGSGQFGFEWKTSNPANLAYLSDIYSPNPVALGIPPNQTILYGLLISDLAGQCSVTMKVSVTGIENNLSIEVPDRVTICYGVKEKLWAEGSPTASGWNNIFNQYSWQTTNSHHVGIENEHSSSLILDELTNSYPSPANAPYIYTARYTDRFSGCYVEKEIPVTVKEDWKYKGYVPGIASAVEGASVNLWNSYPNEITVPNPNSSATHFSVAWLPSTPTNIQLNSGVNTLVPKNAKFTPTTAAPYMTMRITESECQKDFTSMRYIMSSLPPELRVESDNGVVCKGGEMCFDLYFDAHLANYQTSLLPEFVIVKYQLDLDIPAYTQTPKVGYITMFLENSSGLYKANFCEKDYFNFSYGNNSWYSYKLTVNLLSPASAIWGNLSTVYKFKVSEPSGLNSELQTCVYNGNGMTVFHSVIRLGVLPCNSPNGTTMYPVNATMAARDFIEIFPDGNIEITSGANNPGVLLLINPCIKDNLTSDPVEERGATVEEKPLDKNVNLEVFPNPFANDVTIRYTVPADCPGDVTLYLRDFTGRQIKTIEKRANASAGTYQYVFDGSGLPPGIYLYELMICNGTRAVKKVEKIGY